MSDAQTVELARRAAQGDLGAAQALVRSLERAAPSPQGMGDRFVPEQYMTGPDNSQRLSSAKIGMIGSEPGLRFDAINAGPAPPGIRQDAHWEARQLVQDDPTAIIFAEKIAMGFREALATCGALAFEPNLVAANVRSEPVELFRRVLVVPQNPTSEQLAWAASIAQANQFPVTFATSGTDPFSTWVQVNGTGEVAGFDVQAGWVGIVDKLGVTSFSLQAEQELLWSLGQGAAQTTSGIPQNASIQLLPTLRGWPLGNADEPGMLNGRSRLAPQNGSPSNNVRISFRVQHTGTTTPVQSTPHYVEVYLRGWKIQIGRNNRPISVGVGGANCGGPGCS